MSNNIVLLPTGGDDFDQLVLTSVASSITWAGGAQGSAVYTGTITNGANNGLRGLAFTVSGFAGPNNNGRFLALTSTATTLTLGNSLATAETAPLAGSPPASTAIASYGTQLFPSQYATKIEKLQSTNNGDNVSIALNGGETLVAVAFGLKSYDPFDLLHGTAPYGTYPSSPTQYTTPFGFTQSLNDFNANPTISDNAFFNPSNPNDTRLGTAANYALLAYSGITNTGATVISGGNIGSSVVPATQSGMTLVPPAAIDNADAAAARIAGNSAFTYYTGLPVTLALTTADIGSGGTQHSVGAPNGTYYAGVYVSPSSIAISTPIILDAQGNPNATFVFYSTASTVTQAIAGTITLVNGALPQNVIWVVGSSWTSIGPGAITVGNILAYTSITLGGGSLNGRALAVGGGNGAVTIATAETVTVPPIGTGDNNWVLMCHINLVDSDYTPVNVAPALSQYSSIPPTPGITIQAPSSKWNLDGYYPSLYVWVATNALPGTYNINLNSVYQNVTSTHDDGPQDLAAGKPIFDGGVNFQVIKLSGTGAPDACTIGESSANPATPGPITTAGVNGDALISVGLMKSGNVFQPGNVGGTPTSLTFTSAAAAAPQIGTIYTGTITGGANNAFAGYTFTVTGFVNEGGANNGTYLCTASSANTLTLSNGSGVPETHAGTAATTAPMKQISTGKLVGSEAHYMIEYALTAPGSAGSFNPSFLNPLGYQMVICSIAIQSS